MSDQADGGNRNGRRPPAKGRRGAGSGRPSTGGPRSQGGPRPSAARPGPGPISLTRLGGGDFELVHPRSHGN